MTNPNKGKFTETECKYFVKLVSNIILEKFHLVLKGSDMYYTRGSDVEVKIEYKESELIKFLNLEKVSKVTFFPRNVYEIYSYLMESKYFNKDLFLYRLMETSRVIGKDNERMRKAYFEWHKFIKGMELVGSASLFTRNEKIIIEVIKNNFKKASRLEENIRKQRSIASVPQYKFNMAIANSLIREFKDYDLAMKTHILEEFKLNVISRFQLKYNDYLSSFQKEEIAADFKTFFNLEKSILIKDFTSPFI